MYLYLYKNQYQVWIAALASRGPELKHKTAINVPWSVSKFGLLDINFEFTLKSPS